MSYGQLFPEGTVPSLGIADRDVQRVRARLRLHHRRPVDRHLPRRDAGADAGRRRLAGLRHPHRRRLVPAARQHRVLRRRLPGLHAGRGQLDRLRLRAAGQGRLRRRPDRRPGDRLQRLRLGQGRRRRLLHAGVRRLRRQRRLPADDRRLPVQPAAVRQHLAALGRPAAAVPRRRDRPARLHQRRPAGATSKGSRSAGPTTPAPQFDDCAANGGTGSTTCRCSSASGRTTSTRRPSIDVGLGDLPRVRPLPRPARLLLQLRRLRRPTTSWPPTTAST